MMEVSSEIISDAATIIRNGGLVAFPTETVYGLGADALNPSAVIKIFEAKKRPFFDPLICHVADTDMLRRITTEVPEPAQKLIEKFWPGPLTIVLPKAQCIPEIITSGLPTVAVRMPNHPIALELIRRSGTAVAAPSANPFGYLSPTEAAHVRNAFGGEIDLIIDGGRCNIGVESTIIRFDGNHPILLRPGGLETEEIEKYAGPVFYPETIHIPDAPGLLPSHYAPKTKLVLIDEGEEITARTENSALLTFGENKRKNVFAKVLELSPDRNIRTAAINLFAFLHQLDYINPDVIYAERIPSQGLGMAIMNRLEKASF